MVVLTATALTYRTFTRSDMAISQREQQVITNAATPAIDRAKAKIEFLFRRDPRFPSGVPASDILSDLMATRLDPGNDHVGFTGRISPLMGGPSQDQFSPYTLPDETRVDINGDDDLDNAWSFTTDIDGDGRVDEENEIIVYSIIVDDQGPRQETTVSVDDPNTRANTEAKANALVTRTGPLATTEASPACAGALAEGGWQVVTQGNNSTLQKNFQVNAFVANGNNANRTFETLEFQQSRIASRASRWGAWFRYDLEVFPGSGAPLNWNGAMHTEGSFFSNNAFRAHMISSHNSCLYTQEASTITMAEVDADDNGVIDPRSGDFQGQAVRGEIGSDNYTANSPSTIHHWDGPGVKAVTNKALNQAAGNNLVAHSVTGGQPSDIAMNPLTLFTRDVSRHIDPSTWNRRDGWDADTFARPDIARIINDDVTRPFVDDFFRADNRWGPKPRYDSRDTALDVTLRPGTTIGDPIDQADVASRLTNDEDGLDGFWERQAIRSGLRLIVGERLELGNAKEWGYDPRTGDIDPANESMYPPLGRPGGVNNRYGGKHEYLQRRSLRDNLAAVQGMVVYHYQKDDGEFPAACMAMTAHPGTPQSILNSRTFGNYESTNSLKADFLNGVGTNGWEFQFPSTFDTESEFAAQIADGQPLGIALRNLARFAGDPRGGAPSFEPVQDGDIHPAPFLSMWGDFSPLRRILVSYDTASGTATQKYNALSPADKATLHSAACTLSLLAYNTERDLAELESTVVNNNTQLQNVSQQLSRSIRTIMDCLEASPTAKGGNACRHGNFEPLTFLQGRGDIDSNNVTVWEDPQVTVITEGNLCPATGPNSDQPGFQARCDAAEYYQSWRLSDWTSFIGLPNVSNSLSDAQKTQLIVDLTNFAESINTFYAALRDRDLGFREGISTKAGVPYNPSAGSFVDWDGTTGLLEPVGGFAQGNNERVFRTGCDPNIFQSLSAKGGGGANNNIMLGLMACSELDRQPVRYPSLYYLFPVNNHDHDGTDYHQQPDGDILPSETQQPEPYITDSYVRTVNPMVNDPDTYRIVGNNDVTGISAIAAEPRSATATTWTVPAAAGTGAPTANNISDVASAFKVLGPGGTVIRVPFLDKGIFDGREQLNTRVLDIDIEALTTRTYNGGDFWLTSDPDNQAEGVVYAFREDAVREDEIVRPRGNGTTDCEAIGSNNRFVIETNESCRARYDGLALNQDPPLTDDLISLKPVDFIPDPQRRAHGFRLRTSSNEPADNDNEPADFSGDDYARDAGMTFVTDNSVYIQGDFNLHSTDGTRANIVEEFEETLHDKTLANAFGNNFYNSRTNLNLDEFANLAVDHWRPVEILSDSLSVLSGTYRDGAVIDTFIRATPANEGNGTSSYMNQNRPRFTGDDLAPADWVLEEPDTPGSPVWIDRNGTYYRATGTPANRPMYDAYDTDGRWMNFASGNNARRRNVQQAETTYVNALFVSGIVPKRPGQSYGGLHNYPRLQEYWSDSRELHIAGAFIQLNFSTAATGPYDQDAWEEDDDEPGSSEEIGYYFRPRRRWGYDVGLLYVPPAPAARRFVNIGAPRSEYYRELPADDPYIVNLRCARNGDGSRVLEQFCPS